jgi:glycosyltransferase involved in cell wall biosynthesis
MPKFSVIMPSFLGVYRNAAKERDGKIIRAVNSVLNQTFTDFELIVVADGCKTTMDLVSQYDDPRIRSFFIPKAKMWAGEPRNKGLTEAQGEFIVYLDIDDVFGENHLKSLFDIIGDKDWVWFDDNRYLPKTNQWYQNACDIMKIGRCGTSNICHKRELDVHWNHDGYAHDFYFIEQLRNYKNFGKVDAGEYFVCHLPGNYDL